MHISLADLHSPTHQRAIVELLDMYAQHEFGASQPLPPNVRENLIPGLQAQPGALIYLAWSEAEPIGLAICFLGFSSFQAQPLINIHDLAVAPQHRGQGVGRALLTAIREEAERRGCCRVTLEVRCDNLQAQRLYRRMGFEGSQPETWFWMQKLTRTHGDR